MKYLVIILLAFNAFATKAQLPWNTTPTQFSTGYFRQGWHRADSGHILANRAPNFTPRYAGSIFLYPEAGIDTSIFYWTGGRFIKLIPGFDSTSLSNRINLKLNISDTSNMLLPYLRKADTTNKWVQDVYVRNDSLFKFKNGAETFLDTLGSGGASGTVTSVALSMPSAFSVTGSPITTSGTFNISGAGTTTQYIRGNGTLATTDTGMIPDFHLKVRSLFSGTSPITYNTTTGAIGILRSNTSGQLGAATFNNSNFTDDGSGLISFRDIVAAGSCTNCNFNVNSKGQIVSYASGTPPVFANALGAGDTLARGDTIKRLNPGWGILHTVDDSRITQNIDTSSAGVATQYDLTQLTSTSLNNIGSGFRWAATPNGQVKTVFSSNTILWDSISNASGLTAKVDTSEIATQSDIISLLPIPDFSLYKNITQSSKGVRLSQTDGLFLGDSYMAGTGASPFVGMEVIVSERIPLTSQNAALASHGYGTAVRQSYFNQDTTDGSKAVFIFCGFNDVYRAAGTSRLNNNIRYTVRSILANQFLATAIPANNAGVTYGGGTWGTTFPADSAGLKCSTMSGGLPTSTFDGGATASWTVTSSSIVIGFASGDGVTYKMDSFTVSIDGNNVGTFSFDSSNYDIAAGSTYPVSRNKAGQAVLVFQNLDNVSHTVVVTKGTNTSKRLVIDYFGTLAFPNNCAPLVIASIPYFTQSAKNAANVDYGVTVTDAIVDTLNTIIANEIEGFSAFPASMFETNDYLLNPSGFAADSIHPNPTGHMAIAQGFLNKIISNAPSFYAQDGALLGGNSNRTVELNGKGLLFTNAINQVSIGLLRLGGDTYKAGISADGTGDVQYMGVGVNEANTRGANAAAYGGSIYFDSRGGQAPIGFFVHPSGTTSSTYAGQIGGNGKWRIGPGIDANPSVGLYMNFTDAARLPSGTDGDRPSGAAGYFRYNTTSSIIEWHNGSTWVQPVTSNPTTIYTGDGTIPTDRTVTAGTNTLAVTGSAAFADGAQFDVTTSGSVGIAIRGTTTDGRGVMGIATTGAGVYGTATGAAGYGVFANSSGTGGNAMYGSTTSGVILEGIANPTSTNTVIPVFSITRSSQSSGANGIGLSIDLKNRTSTSDELSNQIISKWTDATNATRTSQFEIYGVNSATTARKAALAGNGQWTWDGYGAGTFTGTPTGTIQVTSAGAVIEGPILAAGLFTPTLTAVSNTSSPLLDGARYNRVGNVVTFSLRFSVTTTSGSTSSSIRVALPVSSAFNNANNAAGTNSGSLGQVEADAANDELTVSWISGTGGSETITVTGQYTIL